MTCVKDVGLLLRFQMATRLNFLLVTNPCLPLPSTLVGWDKVHIQVMSLTQVQVFSLDKWPFPLLKPTLGLYSNHQQILEIPLNDSFELMPSQRQPGQRSP